MWHQPDVLWYLGACPEPKGEAMGNLFSKGLRLRTLLTHPGKMSQQESSPTFCFIASE